jgi:hypothetical protein
MIGSVRPLEPALSSPFFEGFIVRRALARGVGVTRTNVFP